MQKPELPDIMKMSIDQKDELLRLFFEELKSLTARLSAVEAHLFTPDHGQVANGLEKLVDFLSRNATCIDPDELNRIKCQSLDLYYALRSGKLLNVEADPQLWLYSSVKQQIIFPCSVSIQAGRNEASSLYKSWAELLVGLNLWLIKPGREKLEATEQAALQQKVSDELMNEVAAFAAVDKIYLMGSALRGDMGSYAAPFVSGHEAKLGTDVIILLELDMAREVDIPGHWELIKQDEEASRCAIYRIKQIPIKGGFDVWVARYPNLPFIQHLVEAYVFFPSRGHAAAKDAFLNKYSAKLFYDRSRDGVVNHTGEETIIAARLAQVYGFGPVVVEKMNVITLNALYKVFTAEHTYVLKLFKVSGAYVKERIAEHAAYEKKLVTQLKQRGIVTAGIIPVMQGMDSDIETYPALLFERIYGEMQMKPEYALDKICAALARVHQVQMDHPLDLDKDFSFEGVYEIWQPLFKYNLNGFKHRSEIAAVMKKMQPLFKRCDISSHRKALYASGPSVHNHGDMTPKNVLFDEQGTAILFDFNNAFYGPRIVDVLDGAFEFSLAEQYIHMADFVRFDSFIARYTAICPFTAREIKNLPQWIELVGLIKLTKEVNCLRAEPEDGLHTKRALAIANYLLSR